MLLNNIIFLIFAVLVVLLSLQNVSNCLVFYNNHVTAIQTTRFMKIKIFDDAQLSIVEKKDLFVVWHSNIVKPKIIVQDKPMPISMLQQKNFNWLIAVCHRKS